MFSIRVCCGFKIQPQQYQRSLMLTNLAITIFAVVFYAVLGKSEFADIQRISILTFGLPILWYVFFLFLHIRNQFNLLAQCILAVFWRSPDLLWLF